MDSRGYGRRAAVPVAIRRTTGALVLAGLLGCCAGSYGLLDAGSPPLLGLPLVVGGALLAGTGSWVAGRRVQRSRYRPDPWLLPEWLTVLSGVAAAAATIAASLLGNTDLNPSVDPPVWPALPLLPLVGVLIALLPAFVTPLPPSIVTRSRSAPVVPVHAEAA
jgi:energy-coupling factor transport system permease protein